MKRILIIATAVILLAGGCGPGDKVPTWAEEFNGNEIDWSVWSKIPRGTPHWQIHMSDCDDCFEMRDGCLVLKGIVNPRVAEAAVAESPPLPAPMTIMSY